MPSIFSDQMQFTMQEPATLYRCGIFEGQCAFLAPVWLSALFCFNLRHGEVELTDDYVDGQWLFHVVYECLNGCGRKSLVFLSLHLPGFFIEYIATATTVEVSIESISYGSLFLQSGDEYFVAHVPSHIIIVIEQPAMAPPLEDVGARPKSLIVWQRFAQTLTVLK